MAVAEVVCWQGRVSLVLVLQVMNDIALGTIAASAGALEH